MTTNSVNIKIQGKEYEVAYPNVGQYYSIECLKESLSKGTYGKLLLSNTTTAIHALDMIDVEAALTVLCPKLIQDLKVPISQLGIKDYNEIKTAFIKDVVPFFKEINELLS